MTFLMAKNYVFFFYLCSSLLYHRYPFKSKFVYDNKNLIPNLFFFKGKYIEGSNILSWNEETYGYYKYNKMNEYGKFIGKDIKNIFMSKNQCLVNHIERREMNTSFLLYNIISQINEIIYLFKYNTIKNIKNIFKIVLVKDFFLMYRENENKNYRGKELKEEKHKSSVIFVEREVNERGKMEHFNIKLKQKEWFRNVRILNEEKCFLNCGKGVCKNVHGYEYCNCPEGFSSNPEKNFECEEHCKVNNGGCDKDAICVPILSEEEEKNNVVKGVGVICKCKNGNTKYNGYYCG
ncbi:hypothetical protein PFUGPA_03533 [Plasmodium falciparum Palo Alto/Uganda]|uniref:Uncharacterized protein n=2 Tax=Plasmodium falciparum TaxID=5833 RepID=W4IV34_PLAFP|nr:hypothetical protein PFUGPA_03533 [Plasmodium falciparum Palo Alto/Uganda]ETW59109.1 hypothetical protein PFMC_04990 [Plasmodium falciparum CAMP/Malaysia]